MKNSIFNAGTLITQLVVFALLGSCNFNAKFAKNDDGKGLCALFPDATSCGGGTVKAPETDAEILAAASYIRIEASVGGTSAFTTHTMTADDTLTLHAAAYDGSNVFLGNISVNWTIQNAKGLITAGPSSSTIFTANVTGTEIVDLSINAFTDSTGDITVNPGVQASVKVNDAAGSGGVELDTNTLTTDQTDLLYASSYDSDGNWIADVAADWIFVNDKGSFNAAVNSVSAATSVTFNADATTSAADHAVVRATFGGDTDDTGTTVAGIEINLGGQAYIKVNDAAGSGGVELNTNTLTADQTDLLYASSYDADGNWIADVAADWSFVNDKGSFNASVNTVAGATSVTFNADITAGAADHAVIRATFGGDTDDTGTTVAGIEINVGAQASIKVNDAAGSGGSELNTNTLTADQTDLLYSSSYDADGNWIANVAADWTFVNDKGSFNASVNSVSAASSVTFNADIATSAADHAVIRATFGGDTDDTGTTVAGIEINTGAQASIKINDAAGSGGSELNTNTMTTDQTDLLYASSYDGDGNWIADVAADWIFVNDKGSFNASVNSVSAATSVTFNADVTAAAADHAVIRATFGGDTDDTGTTVAGIEITVGAQAAIKINDAAGSGGSELNTNTLTTDQTDLLYSSSYDADGNWIANVAADWSFVNDKGSFNASVNTVAGASSVTFNADVTAGAADHCVIRATFGGDTDDTGTTVAGIEITVGAQAAIKINDAAGSGGSELDTNTLNADQTDLLYSSSYDADGNWIANVAADWIFVNDKGSFNASVNSVSAASSVTFNADVTTSAADHAVIQASFGGDNDDTGTVNAGIEITVGAQASVRINDASGSGGAAKETNTMTADDNITLHGAAYDGDGNFISNPSGTWTFTNDKGSFKSGSDDNSEPGASVVFYANQLTSGGDHAVIHYSYGGDTDDTGAIGAGFEITAGAITAVKIEDKNDGTGAEITTDFIMPQGTYTLHAVGYDADSNFVSSPSVTWALASAMGVFDSNPSGTVVFTANNAVGTETFDIDDGSAHTDTTGVFNIGTEKTDANAMVGTLDICAGEFHACAVQSDNKVKCWGSNGDESANIYGQLGHNNQSAIAELVPVTVQSSGADLTNAEQVVCGKYFTCALITGGQVKCWGTNNYGQLADGTGTTRWEAVNVLTMAATNLTTALEITAGAEHACARVDEGGSKKVRCWGRGTSGRLGDGDTANNLYAELVESSAAVDLVDVVNVAAGADFTCVAKTDNTALCWGENGQGQLGNDGGLVDTSYADAVVKETATTLTLPDVQKVFAEQDASTACAILTDGTGRCWGDNFHGKIGHDIGTYLPDEPMAQPVTTDEVAHLQNLKSISISNYSSHGITGSSGEIAVWGVDRTNYENKGCGTGLCGSGGIANAYVADADGTTKQKGAEQIVSGAYFSCIRYKASGHIECFGYSGQGIHGNIIPAGEYDRAKYDVLHTYSPGYNEITNAASVSVGDKAICVTLTTGKVKCTGTGDYYETGGGGHAAWTRAQVVQIDGGGDLDNVAEVDSGTRGSCVRRNDGTIWCWGHSNYLPTQGNSGYAKQAYEDSGYTTVITGATSLAYGAQAGCATINDGKLRCWGNDKQVIGQGAGGPTFQRYGDAVETSAAVDLTGVGIGVSVGANNTCVVMADTTAKCYGEGSLEANGDNTSTDTYYAATSVLDSGLIADTNITKVSQHNAVSCFMFSDGTAACTGTRANGAVGDGNGAGSAQFVDVKVQNGAAADLTGIIDIAVGENGGCAIVDLGAGDQRVKCWGAGNYGANGDNSIFGQMEADSYVLNDDLTTLTDAAQIDAYGYTFCVTTTASKVKCWGKNAYGQMGEGGTTFSLHNTAVIMKEN